MNTCDRFYRFYEFGRELVYDAEGATAFFLNEVEAALLDRLQEGTSLEECIALLKTVYTDEEIAEAVEHIEREGFLTDPQIPYQDISPVYTLTLNVAQECNLRCKYCYVEKPGPTPIMSEEIARRAVDFILKFKDMEGFGVSFYGGEPLLNFPVIKSTIEYASKEAEKRGLPEVKYHITTNGTLITDEMIDFFTAYHIDVMISIDGPASIQDALRVTATGEGTHAVVSEALQKLIDAKGNHKVSTSGVVTNQGRLKDAYQYLSQFPLRDIKLSYVRYLDENEEKKYALSESQKKQYMEDMRDLALECINLIMKGARPPYYNFENNILQLWKHTRKGYFCPAGLTRFGISPGGDIYPCGPAADLGEWKLGTLDKGLDQVLVDRWVARTSFENRAECNPCWARYLCMGGCPLQQLKEVDEQRCTISHHSTRLAIAIYATVKEQNEMMLASLIDPEFLSKIREMIQKAKQ